MKITIDTPFHQYLKVTVCGNDVTRDCFYVDTIWGIARCWKRDHEGKPIVKNDRMQIVTYCFGVRLAITQAREVPEQVRQFWNKRLKWWGL